MFGMTRTIQSLTARCLFHPWVLDHVLSPSDRQIYRVSSTGNSALDVLKKAAKDPCSSPKNRSYLCLANKYFLLTPVKIAYIAFVTLFLSRIGTILNASLTVYSYIRYTFATKENVDPFWEKTEKYARACFQDLVCAVIGTYLTKLIVESTLYTLHFARISPIMGKCYASVGSSVLNGGSAALGVLISTLILIAFQHPEYAPQIFADSETRIGMHLALSLRKSLGLAGKDGGLLPYSDKDKLEYNESRRTEDPIQFSGKNYDTLFHLYFNAELDLIQTVQKCNELLPPDRQIIFSYPLNGQIIADRLESTSTSSKTEEKALVLRDKTSLNVLAGKLRDQQFKITLLKRIFETAEELTFNDPILVLIFKQVFKIPKEFFNSCKSNPVSDKFSWASVNIEPLDPSSKTRPTNNLFEEFKYDVAVNKWSAQNGKAPKSEQELLGLNQDSTYQDFANTRRKYLLDIHPDKHSGDPEALVLSQVLITILNKLKDDYTIGQE